MVDQHKPPTPPPAQPQAQTPQTPPRAQTPQTPIGQARHAETKEEVERLKKDESAAVPPPGSRNYVAGQPIDEEELAQTEAEANALAEQGKKAREKEEKAIAERVAKNAEHNPMKDEPIRRERPDVVVPEDAARNTSKK